MTAASIGAVPRWWVRALPEEQDHPARARGLLPDPRWRADAGPPAGGWPTPRPWRGWESQAGGPVDGADFIALMEGRHPGTGRWLRPEGAGGGRGGGIDLTLADEVRLDGMGARGPVAAGTDRGRRTAGRSSSDPPPARAGARRAPPPRGQVVEKHAKDVIATEDRHTTARESPAPARRTPSCTATLSSPAPSMRTTGSWPSRRGRSSA